MVTGLGLGIAASGHQAVAGFTGLTAVDPNNSYFLSLDGGTAIGSGTSADFTFAFWLKNLAETDTGTLARIEGPGTDIIFINNNTATGKLRFGVLDGGWDIDLTIDISDIQGDNNWHHFVYSRDGSASTHHWYVDGSSRTITVGSSRNNYGAVISFGTYQDVFILSETNGGGNLCDTPITQLFIADEYYNITVAGTLDKFYDGGAVDMGTDGTSSGLNQPELFFTGDTSTFNTNGGSLSISMTTNGTGVDVTAANGPQPA